MLVTGASGGVGLAAVQLASRIGARVVALTTAATADAVVEVGADVALDRRGDVPAQLAEALEGPLDAVVDVVGNALFSRWPGWLAAHVRSWWRVRSPGPRSRWTCVHLDQRRIVGSSMHTPRQFQRVVHLAHDENLDVPVAATYTLDAVHDAQVRFATGGTVGVLRGVVGSVS